MPVYWLGKSLVFPPPEAATDEGVVAAGGDASAERLVLAYSQGIFPWPVEGMPLLWFSPDPRFVLLPEAIHVSRSLRRRIARRVFDVRADTAFADVIRGCAGAHRPGQRGTWITPELVRGYEELFARGYAHSIEAWRDGELVGGIYGVSLGAAFFAESMYAREPDASKVALVTLAGNAACWGMQFIDCQVHTAHVERFGAQDWSRERYLRELRAALAVPTRSGPWSLPLDPVAALARVTPSVYSTLPST